MTPLRNYPAQSRTHHNFIPDENVQKRITLLDVSAMEVAAEVAGVAVAVGIRGNKTGVSEATVRIKAQLRVRWFIQVQVGDKWCTSCKKTLPKNTKRMTITKRNCRASLIGIA